MCFTCLSVIFGGCIQVVVRFSSWNNRSAGDDFVVRLIHLPRSGAPKENIDPFLAQERTCHQNQSEMRNGNHVRFTGLPTK